MFLFFCLISFTCSKSVVKYKKQENDNLRCNYHVTPVTSLTKIDVIFQFDSSVFYFYFLGGRGGLDQLYYAANNYIKGELI